MYHRNMVLRVHCTITLAVLPLLLIFAKLSVAENKAQPESTVTLPIQTDIKTIEGHLNKIAPDTLANINDNKVCVEAKWLKTKGIPRCRMRGIKIYCEDRWIKTKITPDIRCDIKGWVKRNGHISVSGGDPTLNFEFPIKAQISAEAAGIRETAKAAAIIYVRAAPRINPDWSISVDIEPDFSWSQRPTLKLFGIIKVTIGSRVEPKLRELMGRLVKKVPELLDELNVKEKVAALWNDIQDPLIINDNPEIYALFKPESVSYSGFDIVGGNLRTTIGVKGKTQSFLGQPSDDNRKTELPELGSIPYQEGKFHAHLPIFIPYKELSTILTTEFPDGYSIDLNIGQIKESLTVSDPKIKKIGNGKIAVAVRVRVTWPNVDGEINFTGSPRIEDRTLFVDDLEYHSNTNSFLFDRLVAISGLKFVRDFISNKTKYDFGHRLDDEVKKANDALSITLNNGAKVSAFLKFVSILQLAINEESIQIDTELSGIVNATIGL